MIMMMMTMMILIMSEHLQFWFLNMLIKTKVFKGII